MRIVNRTRYDTKKLRAIIARIATEEVEAEKRKRLRITIEAARQQYGVSGRATTGGSWSTIRIPTRAAWTEDLQLQLCATVAHELAHNHGHRGERWMRNAMRYSNRAKHRESQRLFYAWALDPEMMLTPKPVKPKAVATPAGRVEQKVAKIEASIANWTRKAKLAATKLKKLRQRQRYYAKRVAVAASEAARRVDLEQAARDSKYFDLTEGGTR